MAAIKEDLTSSYFGRKKEEEPEKEKTIPKYYDDLIRRMEDGIIHTDKKSTSRI